VPGKAVSKGEVVWREALDHQAKIEGKIRDLAQFLVLCNAKSLHMLKRN